MSFLSFTLSVKRSHSPFTRMLWMVWPVWLKWLPTGLSLRCLMSARCSLKGVSRMCPVSLVFLGSVDRHNKRLLKRPCHLLNFAYISRQLTSPKLSLPLAISSQHSQTRYMPSTHRPTVWAYPNRSNRKLKHLHEGYVTQTQYSNRLQLFRVDVLGWLCCQINKDKPCV